MKKLKLLLAFCALLIGWSNASAQGWTASAVAAGDFYLYNVRANAFLNQGARWNTHGALNNNGVKVTLAQSNGKYTIYTGLGNGHYVNSNGYVDSSSEEWTFEPVDGLTNTYKLKSAGGNYLYATSGLYNVMVGSDTDDSYSYWKLVTKDNLENNAIASLYNPLDVTRLINNPQFDKLNSYKFYSSTGWTGDVTLGGNIVNKNYNVNSGLTESDYNIHNPCAERYDTTFDVYQEISDLANGVYAVSVQGFYREGGYAAAATKHVAGTESLNAKLYANSEEQPLMSIFEEAGKASGGNTATATGIDGAFPNNMAAASYFLSADLYWNTVYVKVTDGTLKIGVKKSATVGSDWTIFDNFRLQYYGNDCTVEQVKNAALKKAWDEAYSAAEDAKNDPAYAGVVGAELTALNTEIDKAEPTTAEGYETATRALTTATSNFIAAAPNYVLLATEKTKAGNLGMSAAAIAEVTPLTKTGLKALQDLKVAEYNFVTTNYSYAVELGTWTTTGPTGSLSEQHYKGAGYPYLEQSSEAWNSGSWEIKYEQNLSLPAGNYVFKVAGRQADSDGVTLSLTVKNGSSTIGTVSDFPRGDVGLGINKDGATDFTTGAGHEYVNDGKGRAWQWRYVKFTLAEPATVNVAVDAVATIEHMWVSFCDATVQTDDDANISLIAYNIALNDANTAINNDSYTNVKGSEKTALQAAIDADEGLDKTDADAIEAATTALDNARVAFTNAKTSYDTYVAAKAVEYEDNLPYASATKFAAIATAQEAADATSASDAVAKTNAILSAYRKYVESNALAEGVGGIDKTNLISDANFSGVTIVDQTAGAWAFSQTGGAAAILSGESFTDGDGNANYSYFDYNNNGANNQNLSQTLTALPKGQYLLTVTARATTAMAENYYLSVDFDETSAKQAIPAIGNTGGTFGRGWNDVSVVFNHVSDGDVTIHVYGQNGKAGWSGATRFRLAKIDKEVSITSAGWATLYTSYALDFSGVEGLKAYTATVNESTVTLTPVDDVPANTGVVLKGAENTYTIPVIASSETAKGSLRGSATETTNADAAPTGKAYYILTKDGDNAKFSPATGIIAAGKAYLEYDWSAAGGSVKALNVVVDGTITGVEAPVAAEAEEEGVLYNTAGQVVTKDYKGIIIKNGKKYLNK